VVEKQKTLSYRRAEFLTSVDGTLEEYLANAHSQFTTIAQRRVEVPGHPTLECRKHLPQQNLGILLHIAAYTPGEHASVVPRLSENQDGDVGTTPPPEHCEFMDGDIMVLVVGNHVLLCATNLHEKRAERYMTGIIEATGLPRNASTFSLCRSANVDKLRLIQSQGVKAINLDVSLFDATLDNIDRTTVRQQIGGILMDQVKAMIFKDKTPEEIANAENLTARVILTYDSRKKGMSLGREGVEQLAIQMLDDDDEGFSIRTAGGQRIKGSDISLTKIVKIQKHGKSVFCSDAWRELETYYYELRADGLLEQ
jgi:hypothetical protein